MQPKLDFSAGNRRGPAGGKSWSKKSGKDGKGDGKEKEIAHNHKEQKELKRKRQAENNPNFEKIVDVKVGGAFRQSTAVPGVEALPVRPPL